MRGRSAALLIASVAVVACGSDNANSSVSNSGTLTPTPTPLPPGPMVIAGERASAGDAGLYMVNADGSGLRHIANTVKGDRAPSLSPDGKRIAFVGQEDSDDAISVINTDGSGRTKLTAGGSSADDDVPTWSPDGTRILFLRDHAPGYLMLIMRADGADLRQVTTVADGTDEMVRPSWSPDGKQIVYEDLAPPTNTRDIFVVSVSGGDRHRLGAPGRSVQDYQAAWSPDGTQIAYVEQAPGDTAIFVMNADGTVPRRLSAPQADDSWPAWSLDGSQIALERPQATGHGVVVIDKRGQPVSDLKLAGDFHTPSWSTAPSPRGFQLPVFPSPPVEVSPTPE